MSRAAAELRALLGEGLVIEPLTGGCVGEVHRVRTRDGRVLVVKTAGAPDSGLDVEGAMLEELARRSDLPVPRVHHATPRLLLMDWLPGETGCRSAAEPDAARLFADLHAVRGEQFGFDFDTRIGGLVQPNGWRATWCEFFAEQRLLAMTRAARDAGELPERTAERIERVAGRLGEWLEEPATPALLHGDLWSGNLLSAGASVTGCLDPAIYFGHPEVELAFSTLFQTFTPAFYEAYGDRARPLDTGFWEVRRHLYNLYPLLVHVRLFGRGYLAQLEACLQRFG